MVPCTRLADGPYRVDVSCDEEEDGHSAAATDDETEEGQLEKVRCGFGSCSRRMQPGDEGSAQVATDDHEGGYATEALRCNVLAAVTRAQKGRVWVVEDLHLSSLRRGEPFWGVESECNQAKDYSSSGYLDRIIRRLYASPVLQ